VRDERGSRLKPLLQGEWFVGMETGFGVMGGYVGGERKGFAAEAAPTKGGGGLWLVGVEAGLGCKPRVDQNCSEASTSRW
jgi:hypothetical protein